MKGVVLAGGSGTRLYPVTKSLSKQLLPVFDKPMIYYPISTLMLAGIRDILVITTPNDAPLFQELLGDGSEWGLNFTYAVQHSPAGIAQAIIIAADFIAGGPFAFILGDNIFHGHDLVPILEKAAERRTGATIFAYHVHDPERYGVVEFDRSGKALSLEEKPLKPRSSYAITGLYFYDSRAIELVHSLKPSQRGELEITDLNQLYLEEDRLTVEILGRGFAWLDTGTCGSLLDAGNFIATLEQRQGLKIACPEEIAFRRGWIDATQLRALSTPLLKSGYGFYLRRVLDEQVF